MNLLILLSLLANYILSQAQDVNPALPYGPNNLSPHTRQSLERISKLAEIRERQQSQITNAMQGQEVSFSSVGSQLSEEEASILVSEVMREHEAMREAALVCHRKNLASLANKTVDKKPGHLRGYSTQL